MSKCKASQDARAIQELGLERYDRSGRLVRLVLPSATNDLEERRNQLAQQLLDLKDATKHIEELARQVGMADDLTVLTDDELAKKSKRIASKLTSFHPVRGYKLGVEFPTLAKDYIDNQIYFYATQHAFNDILLALKNQEAT